MLSCEEYKMTPEERRERLYRAMDSGRRATARNRAGYSGNGYRNTDNRTGRTSRPRRRRKNNSSWLRLLIALLIAAALLAGVYLLLRPLLTENASEAAASEQAETTVETQAEEPETETIPQEDQATEILKKAEFMAAQYDYDGALEYLAGYPELSDHEEVKNFIEKTAATKETLVQQDISQVTHIFFHILITDNENAFNEERWGKTSRGFNTAMTTIPEFKAILQSMYDRGFVLVSLHDLAHLEKQEDGTEKMVTGKIMLPPGKKAFVMSEDDVCYYEYMEGTGFADRMVVGEDGRPTLHYVDQDGNESLGDYDIVPILDHFIDEHPDFSYHGHKACLVFTGYNGVLGYRTDETYLPENFEEHKVEGGHDVEAERAEAVKVMKALVEDGYDLGSHSWGHRQMGEISVESLKTDSDRWDKNVNSLIREATGKDADILIYPFGNDIGDWHPYTAAEQSKSGCKEKLDYLQSLGFHYFCNVDSSKSWVQKGDTYLRTGRRALGGYDLYYDMTNNKGRFSDLWDSTSAIFDKDRPTPVDPY